MGSHLMNILDFIQKALIDEFKEIPVDKPPLIR
jgi:hypothetical protein